jgi:carbamoyl-phosphate synthase large subunit
MPFAAAVNIQCRVVNGEPVVFEINPRFSGGIPLTIAAGADFPRYLVDLALGRPVPARIGRFRDQLWMTSYEASIFVDAEELETGRKPPVAIGVVA